MDCFLSAVKKEMLAEFRIGEPTKIDGLVALLAVPHASTICEVNIFFSLDSSRSPHPSRTYVFFVEVSV